MLLFSSDFRSVFSVWRVFSARFTVCDNSVTREQRMHSNSGKPSAFSRWSRCLSVFSWQPMFKEIVTQKNCENHVFFWSRLSSRILNNIFVVSLKFISFFCHQLKTKHWDILSTDHSSWSVFFCVCVIYPIKDLPSVSWTLFSWTKIIASSDRAHVN